MFWTGTHGSFTNVPMGKNTISMIPRQVADLLGKEDPSKFTFHSLRRSSATVAADNGATVAQLMDFYGWKNGKMPQEYVSSSKASVKSMANRLQGPGSEGSTIMDTGYRAETKPEKIIYIQHMSGTINM